MKLSNSLFLDRETKYDIIHKINYLDNTLSEGQLPDLITDDINSNENKQKKMMLDGYYKLLDDNKESA